MMGEHKQQIVLQPESQYKIGTVTYQVTALFDNDKDSLFPILKRLLQREVETEISQFGQHMFSNSIMQK